MMDAESRCILFYGKNLFCLYLIWCSKHNIHHLHMNSWGTVCCIYIYVLDDCAFCVSQIIRAYIYEIIDTSLMLSLGFRFERIELYLQNKLEKGVGILWICFFRWFNLRSDSYPLETWDSFLSPAYSHQARWDCSKEACFGLWRFELVISWTGEVWTCSCFTEGGEGLCYWVCCAGWWICRSSWVVWWCMEGDECAI